MIPQTLLYAPTLNLVRVLKIAIGDLKTFSPMADAIPVSGNERLSVLGPGIGGAAARLACEPYLASGVKKLILFGVCGGILSNDSSLRIGSIILPTEAFYEMPGNLLYTTENSSSFGSSKLRAELARNLEDDHHAKIFSGGVWTTDSPFQENEENASRILSSGVLGVEMECAALLQLAKQYESEFAACLVVSDLLSENWEPGFSKQEVKNSLAHAGQAIAKLVSV